ncbi:hypothetical protein [Enterobacter hormaechei]|uniref:hypothetical protein n=1 Tax=Enterobacter hormaechei TaxID=158836 RepID=UPI0021B05563|nr:hypothetical protein [Enterobacter hormaechei]
MSTRASGNTTLLCRVALRRELTLTGGSGKLSINSTGKKERASAQVCAMMDED